MLDANTVFAQGRASLRVQSIIYNNAPADIERALGNLARAIDIGIASGDFDFVDVALGDCSPHPIFDGAEIDRLRADNPEIRIMSYTHFGVNLGSARGQNKLLETLGTDFALIMNPDVRVAPNTLIELLRPFRHPGIGITEARQLPVEHPKYFDPATGETGWATTACAIIPRAILGELNGFDADTFFLYCDDVDFSWRTRLAGFKVIYQPSAIVFHDKRLGQDGNWLPGEAEKYYSAEASLMMAHKWSRPDLLEHYLANFQKSGIEYLERAAAHFIARREADSLPEPLDPEGKTAEFVGQYYTQHRFAL
jgi:GT2 family glycosyltransferase